MHLQPGSGGRTKPRQVEHLIEALERLKPLALEILDEQGTPAPNPSRASRSVTELRPRVGAEVRRRLEEEAERSGVSVDELAAAKLAL